MKQTQLVTDILMQMHVNALYVNDERQRLVSINDGSGRAAPRFFLGRTAQGAIWRFRHDVPEAICRALTELCEQEPVTTAERPFYETAYSHILATQVPIAQVWIGPAYYVAHNTPANLPATRITEQNRHLLQGELQAWQPDVMACQPFLAVVVDGQAAAVCASVRITDAAHEAGLETAAVYRRQGHALTAVVAWAKAVADMGILPMYSTSIDNVGSQKVAARLGLIRYGFDFHIT